MPGGSFARQISHVFPRRIQSLILFRCWRLFQFLFIRNDLSVLEVLPLTQYSWFHLQHCEKILSAAFCFHRLAIWPKQIVTLQKLGLWRAKRELALHLLWVLWGSFQRVWLLHPQSMGMYCWQGNVESWVEGMESPWKEEQNRDSGMPGLCQSRARLRSSAATWLLSPFFYLSVLTFLNPNPQLQCRFLLCSWTGAEMQHFGEHSCSFGAHVQMPKVQAGSITWNISTCTRRGQFESASSCPDFL